MLGYSITSDKIGRGKLKTFEEVKMRCFVNHSTVYQLFVGKDTYCRYEFKNEPIGQEIEDVLMFLGCKGETEYRIYKYCYETSNREIYSENTRNV
jgi:hypothetical protein